MRLRWLFAMFGSGTGIQSVGAFSVAIWPRPRWWLRRRGGEPGRDGTRGGRDIPSQKHAAERCCYNRLRTRSCQPQDTTRMNVGVTRGTK
ncbi:hypothetical protein BDP55DRAFT_374798 [Colletotrichum godetiae]|uniref:Uncharacterized protein n=1 Tax=Colletotrichum godetiae TaxID=1209918 RepID=A0AAJ0A924_9PEZI|nr:uncharacterized protein BDP55DRAFT_374798 [Colletotrichum godetiae]KAK1658776.1 hypothetical protein BDP55DRAFT_374798 [Colletotrichum godetiae]